MPAEIPKLDFRLLNWAVGEVMLTRYVALAMKITTAAAYRMLDRAEKLGIVTRYGYRARDGWDSVESGAGKRDSLGWQRNDIGTELVAAAQLPAEAKKPAPKVKPPRAKKKPRRANTPPAVQDARRQRRLADCVCVRCASPALVTRSHCQRCLDYFKEVEARRPTRTRKPKAPKLEPFFDT